MYQMNEQATDKWVVRWILMMCFGKGGPESTISDMETYMEMLNPDVTDGVQKKQEPAQLPPPPMFPPPPPPPAPDTSYVPPPPPTYPAPNPPGEQGSAEFLKVKSNLRRVDNKKEVQHALFIWAASIWELWYQYHIHIILWTDITSNRFEILQFKQENIYLLTLLPPPPIKKKTLQWLTFLVSHHCKKKKL